MGKRVGFLLLFALLAVYAQWGCRNNQNNAVVDWWLVYKLPNSLVNGFLYIDSTMDKAKHYPPPFGGVGPTTDAVMHTMLQAERPEHEIQIAAFNGFVAAGGLPGGVALPGGVWAGVVLVTTANPHQLVNGAGVSIANGPHAALNINSVVCGFPAGPAAATQFYYAVVAIPPALAIGFGPAPTVTRCWEIVGEANSVLGGGFPVVNQRKVFTTNQPHGLGLGYLITIQGMAPGGYNVVGAGILDVPGANQFVIDLAGPVGVAGGPAAAPLPPVAFNIAPWPAGNAAPMVFHYQDLQAAEAHARGTVAAHLQFCAGGAQPCAFWLMHSVPNFPTFVGPAGTDITYPGGGHANAQHFFCVSFAADGVENPGLPGGVAAYAHNNRGGTAIARTGGGFGGGWAHQTLAQIPNAEAVTLVGILENLRIRYASTETASGQNVHNFIPMPNPWVYRLDMWFQMNALAGEFLWETTFINVNNGWNGPGTGGFVFRAFSKSTRSMTMLGFDMYQHFWGVMGSNALVRTMQVAGNVNSPRACCPTSCGGCLGACNVGIRNIDVARLDPNFIINAASLRALNLDGAEFGVTHDHSKWAVSTSGAPVSCFADLNRQGGGNINTGNNFRGGGMVCLENQALADMLRNMVFDRYICPGEDITAGHIVRLNNNGLELTLLETKEEVKKEEKEKEVYNKPTVYDKQMEEAAEHGPTLLERHTHLSHRLRNHRHHLHRHHASAEAREEQQLVEQSAKQHTQSGQALLATATGGTSTSPSPSATTQAPATIFSTIPTVLSTTNAWLTSAVPEPPSWVTPPLATGFVMPVGFTTNTTVNASYVDDEAAFDAVVGTTLN